MNVLTEKINTEKKLWEEPKSEEMNVNSGPSAGAAESATYHTSFG